MTATVMVCIDSTHLRERVLAEVFKGSDNNNFDMKLQNSRIRDSSTVQAVPHLVYREVCCVLEAD